MYRAAENSHPSFSLHISDLYGTSQEAPLDLSCINTYRYVAGSTLTNLSKKGAFIKLSS